MSHLPEVSIVLAVHDAQTRLDGLVSGLRSRLMTADFHFEIWLAEHGSTDRTARVAGQLSARFPEVNSFCVGPVSPGTALRRGIAAAQGRYVICDASERGDVDFIGRAVDRLRRQRTDIVVGRTRPSGDGPGRYDRLLRWGVGFASSVPSGLVAFRRAIVAPIAERCATRGGAFATELVVRAERQGLAVDELHVRSGEKTNISPMRLSRAMGDVVELRRALAR